MEFQVPVSTILTQVFGLAGPYLRRFHLTPEQVAEMEANRDANESADVYSMLGTPVSFWMSFVGRDNYRKRSNGKFIEVSVPGIYLPFTSVASFSRAKRLTTTFMGGQGEVIEEFGFEPWHIRIQGLILKNDKRLVFGKSTVEEQMKEILKYEGLSDSVGVKGKGFEWRGIHEVGIMSINFPEAKGYDPEVVMPYEMILRSVTPIELIEV